jgi:hypothetical protein
LLSVATVTLSRIAHLVFLAALAVPSRGWAQTEGKFAVGGNLSARAPTGDQTDGHLGVGLLWRFGHAKTGWGWHYGLSWFSTHVDQSIGDIATEFGELKVRPIMAGYGYTQVIGRTAITAQVMGGYAFSSISLDSAATDAFRDRLGARSVSIDAANTFVVKPEISAWYDINKKLGLNVSGGYIVARPRVTVKSTLGEDRRSVRADMFMLKVGMVYSIF